MNKQTLLLTGFVGVVAVVAIATRVMNNNKAVEQPIAQQATTTDVAQAVNPMPQDGARRRMVPSQATQSLNVDFDTKENADKFVQDLDREIAGIDPQDTAEKQMYRRDNDTRVCVSYPTFAEETHRRLEGREKELGITDMTLVA